METRAKDAYYGFLPRKRGEAWKDWVTRSLKALEENSTKQWYPQVKDFQNSAQYVSNAPRADQIGQGACMEIAGRGTVLSSRWISNFPAVSAGPTLQLIDYLHELSIKVSVSILPTKEPMPEPTSLLLSPGYMKIVPPQRTAKVRLCLLEFYGTGVPSPLDIDRAPHEALWYDLLVRSNPTSATMANIYTTNYRLCCDTDDNPTAPGSIAPFNKIWFPDAMNSPWRRPMGLAPLVNLAGGYSNSTGHTPIGVQGKASSDATQSTPWVLVNNTPSPWEFECIWEKTIEVTTGPPTQVPAQRAQGPDITTQQAAFWCLDDSGDVTIEMDIPLRKTVTYNNIDPTNIAGSQHYPDRRFYLVAFSDASDMITMPYMSGAGPTLSFFGAAPLPGTGGTSPAQSWRFPPHRVRISWVGQLKYLSVDDALATGSNDDPAIIGQALDMNDLDGKTQFNYRKAWGRAPRDSEIRMSYETRGRKVRVSSSTPSSSKRIRIDN